MAADGILIFQEIGSFRKPDYLSSSFKKIKDQEEIRKLKERATLETIRLFENAGLDNIGVGGEMYRWEMYEHPATRISGIKFYGMVRSFDNRYYRKGSVIAPLSVKEHWHNDELEFVIKNTNKGIKVPLTGPYTMMDWSFNEYFSNRHSLALEFAELLNSEIRSLLDIWKRYHPEEKLQIQIDEPAATTHPDEMGIFTDAINRAVEGLTSVEISMHVCYSTDYRLLYDVSPELKIDGFNLEFANRDSLSVESSDNNRKAYAGLRYFADVDSEKFMGIGVTDVHSDIIESPELIASRIRYSLGIIDDPRRLRINPDCGLRTRSRGVGYEKLLNTSRAISMVREEL